jgi:hypothetical protein
MDVLAAGAPRGCPASCPGACGRGVGGGGEERGEWRGRLSEGRRAMANRRWRRGRSRSLKVADVKREIPAASSRAAPNTVRRAEIRGGFRWRASSGAVVLRALGGRRRGSSPRRTYDGNRRTAGAQSGLIEFSSGERRASLDQRVCRVLDRRQEPACSRSPVCRQWWDSTGPWWRRCVGATAVPPARGTGQLEDDGVLLGSVASQRVDEHRAQGCHRAAGGRDQILRQDAQHHGDGENRCAGRALTVNRARSTAAPIAASIASATEGQARRSARRAPGWASGGRRPGAAAAEASGSGGRAADASERERREAPDHTHRTRPAPEHEGPPVRQSDSSPFAGV